jgi:hypothetical protein
VVAVGFGILGLMGSYQLLFLAPYLWWMGTREKLLARMMVDDFAHYGGGDRVEVLGRNAWADRGASAGPRFRIVQRGGRMVIEMER